MDFVKDPATVRRLLVDKQALEVSLAFDLLEIFNDPKSGLIRPLRKMVSDAILYMDVVYNYSAATRAAFERKWYFGGDSKWRGYAGVQENHIQLWNYRHIKAQVQHFKAEHCADWIRIFGEVIEDVLTPLGWRTEDLIRRAGQKGDPYHWKKFDARKIAEDPIQKDAGRRRILAEKNPQHAEYEAGQTPAWDFMRSQPSAGMARWDVKEGDTLGKMDQVFGLTPGATISGTTTDNIYFIDKFKRLRINPVFYLLPAASLVSGGHHTLLEVAYPLSLNGLIDHKIGLYSTLFPTGAGTSRLPGAEGAAEIERLLWQYENRWENNLMLVWYDAPRDPGGCVLYSHITDKGLWGRLTKADNHLLNVFKRMRPWPNIVQINDVHSEVSFFLEAERAA